MRPGAVWLGLLLSAGGAGALGPAPQLWWGKSSGAEVARLTAQREAADRLMGFYGYGLHDWQIHSLHTPLLRAHDVFKFLWLDARDTASEFVLITPRAGGEAVRLVPIAYDGFEHQDNDLDLHNVAIYNAMIATEPAVQPAQEEDWLGLAELYLNLVGELPQVLDAANFTTVLGPPGPKTPQAGLPTVRPLPGGGARVEFANLRNDTGVEAWTFDFDAHGALLRLDRTLIRPAHY